MSGVGVHPILTCAAAVEEALAEVANVEPVFMSTEDKGEALRRLHALEGRLSGLRLRVMAASPELAQATADHSVATWLAAETRTDVRAQVGDLALARSLAARWTRLGEAVAAGRVNLAQARAIARALEDLPTDEVDAEGLIRAEEALIGYAAHHTPAQLRRLGRRIWEVAAPEASEEAEGRALEREERRAAQLTSLSLHRLGDGTTRLAGRLPDATADRLRTYLDAYTSPRRPQTSPRDPDRDDPNRDADRGHPGRGDRPRLPRQRLGQAFAAFLEAADPRRLPLHGGDATSVLVTIDLETLTGQLAGIGLVGEEPISAAQARRLACTAGLIPAVLDGKSEVLDLGRTQRLFRPAQRKAMAVRDRRCRTEGCTIPAAWCEAHHATRSWAAGGATDLADGVLLCSWHHHRAHDPHYDSRRLPNGDYRFHRRT